MEILFRDRFRLYIVIVGFIEYEVETDCKLYGLLAMQLVECCMKLFN